MKKHLLFAIAIAALLGLGYHIFHRAAGKAAKPDGSRVNLILISLDTTRADYLQIYNPQGAPTPNLKQLAQKGFLFTNAVSQVPFTLPSHCTMLTGTYPMEHLVQENIAAKLSDDALTLAEVLKTNGYQTAGFVGAMVLESGTGIEQGFDTFDDAFVRENRILEDRSGVQKDAGSVRRSFLRWLDHRSTSSPFFSFIHFYDPHAPYDPPARFRPAAHDVKSLYRGEIQYVDSVIGEIVNDLSLRALLDQTVIVITGDHGEMFGEHGETGHGYFVYQEAVHVPLLFILPDQKSGTSNSVVELVDLMPTLLDLLRIAVPESVQGQSIVSVMQDTNQQSGVAYSESLTASQHFGTAPLRAIQDSHYQYIDTPKAELYDLKNDVQQLHNLATENPEIVSKMKGALHQLVQKNSGDPIKQDERKLSPEQQEQLASLGYIASTPSTINETSKLDAKDFIDTWNDLGILATLVKEPNCTECLNLVDKIRKSGNMPLQAGIFAARAHIGLRQYDKAIPLLREILSVDPKYPQAQMVLAQAYKQSGNIPAALGIYKQMMEEENSLHALENYAALMILMNRKDELTQTLQPLTSSEKLDRKYDPVLGEIYVLLQQPDKARYFLQRAIEDTPENPGNYIHMSTLMDSAGRTSEAITYLEQYRNRFHNADYLLQLGKLYGKSGNTAKEYEIFREMVEAHPKDPRGYFFLGKIFLQQQSDMNQVIRLAEMGLSLNPEPEFQPFGYFLLGDAYTALGDKQKAQSNLQKAEALQKRLQGARAF